jgi:uncharacterized protein (TIGR03435 family)
MSFTFRSNLFRLLAVLSALVASAVDAELPTIGKPAPIPQFSAGIQGPQLSEITLEKLRGKLVILEFWATWCGPCLAAFPHINQLAEKYSGQPVQFIAVSTDDGADARTKVEHLLDKRPLNTWVVIDDHGATQARYGVRAIPATYLIGPSGTLEAITYPTALTEAVIDNLLAGKPSGLKESQGETVPATVTPALPPPPPSPATASVAPPKPVPSTVLPTKPAGTEPLLSLSLDIDPTTRGEGLGGWKDGLTETHVTNMRTDVFISFLWRVQPAQVILDPGLPATRWKMDFRFPQTVYPLANTVLRQLAPPAMGVEVTPAQRELAVWVLRAPTGPKASRNAELKRSEDAPGGGSDDSGGLLVGSRSTIGSLISYLQKLLDGAIIDETSLAGRFDWQIAYKKGDRQSLINSLRDCGIEATRENRTMDVLLVSANRHESTYIVR